MPIITLKHNGKIYQREVNRNFTGIYVMHSKGIEYWFRKDANYVYANNGWNLVNGTTLPDFLMGLICEELERLSFIGQ